MKKNKKRHYYKISRIKILWIIIIVLCSIVAMICVFFIEKWNGYNVENDEILEEVKEEVKISEDIVIEENKNEIDFTKLKQRNNDVIGWLKLEGVDIEFPVVQYKDNDYYMTHNIDKNYNSAGWIFVDYKNKLDGTDKNIVIYGHNRRDGSMFSNLKNILTPEWYSNSENKILKLILENDKENFEYEVFSVYQIEAEDYYIQTNFNSESIYEKFLKEIQKRSIYNFNTSINISDRILTLSTCANNNRYRIVLHAKKIK